VVGSEVGLGVGAGAAVGSEVGEGVAWSGVGWCEGATVGSFGTQTVAVWSAPPVPSTTPVPTMLMVHEISLSQLPLPTVKL